MEKTEEENYHEGLEGMISSFNITAENLFRECLSLSGDPGYVGKMVEYLNDLNKQIKKIKKKKKLEELNAKRK